MSARFEFMTLEQELELGRAARRVLDELATEENIKLLRDFGEVVSPKLRDTLQSYGATQAGWNDAIRQFTSLAQQLTTWRASSIPASNP